MKKSKTKNIVLIAAGAIALLAVILTTIFFIARRGRPVFISAPREIQIAVSAGDTLSGILSQHNVSGADINIIAAMLKKDCGVSSLRAGSDRLVITKEHDDAPVDKIILSQGPWRRVELNCDSSGKWQANIIEITKDRRAVYKSGKIESGDSFYAAGMRVGIPAGILADVFDLLAFEIDFERDVRSGQEFSVLYEEHFNDGEKVSNGAVLAVSFDSLRGNVKMYRFKKSDGTIGYYDASGNGAIKSLKRTPINNAKISSSFNPNRKHPVLGYTRAHKGVDFRAATGTPIPAAGAGRVIEKKYGKGWGNYVTIQHNKTYSTRYAHMSKFQKGVNVGTQVRQGQIIGYVGATGIATGPHLHYEIMQNGKHVNPMTVKLPAINNLADKDKPQFAIVREAMDAAQEKLAAQPTLFVQM